MTLHSRISGLALALTATCAALLPATAGAQQDALKRIAQRSQINIGYSEGSPPFSFKDDKGRPAGYSIDYCMMNVEHLRQEVGKDKLRLNMVPVSTDQLPRLVGTGAVDLMCAGVSDTPERRTTMGFSQPIFISDVKLLVRAKDGYKSAADLKDKHVAVLGRTTTEPALKAYTQRTGVALQPSRVVTVDAALSQLRLGNAEAWARDEILLLGVLARQADKQNFVLLPDSLASETIAIALPRDAGLQRVVDQAMALAVRSGRADALYETWFVKPSRAAPQGLNLPKSVALKAEFDRLR